MKWAKRIAPLRMALGPRPDWVPRAVWVRGEKYRWVARIVCAVVVASAGTLAAAHFLAPSLVYGGGLVTKLPFWACAITLLAVWMAVRSQKWWMTSFLRHLEANQSRVCPHCGYPLIGLREVQECPECGTPYDVRELVSMWEKWIADARARALIRDKRRGK
jgi:hypothetical protein